MPKKNNLKHKRNPWLKDENLLFVFIFCIGAFLRAFRFWSFVTVDEPAWFERVTAFIKAVVTHDFINTYQTPHPGATTMWLGGIGYAVYKFLTPLETQDTLWLKIFFYKVPFLLLSIISIIIIYLLVKKLFNNRIALLTTLLYSVNPLFLAHSYIVHIDLTLSIIVAFALLTLLIFLDNERKNKRYLLLAIFLYPLALLNKTPSIIILPVTFAAIIIYQWNLKRSIKTLLLFGVGIILFSFVIWPVLLVNPFSYFEILYLSLFKSAVTTHDTKVIGSYTSDYSYYFLSLMRNSTQVEITAFVLTVIGFLVSIPKSLEALKNKKLLHIGMIITFIAIFFTIMTIAAKRGDRYMMPIYILSMVAFGYFIDRLLSAIKNKYLLIIPIIFLILSYGYDIQSLLKVSPYYSAYYNPLFIKDPYTNFNRGWGEGLELAAHYLNKKKDPEKLIVAVWYRGVFEQFFRGKTLPMEMYNSPDADYVVTYKNMQGRPYNTTATIVLQIFKNKKAEKIFYINNLPFVWIYKLR